MSLARFLLCLFLLFLCTLGMGLVKMLTVLGIVFLLAVVAKLWTLFKGGG